MKVVAHNPRPKGKSSMAAKRARTKKSPEQFGPEYKRSGGILLVRNDGQMCLPASPIGSRMILQVEPDGRIIVGEPLSQAEIGANLAAMRGVNGDALVLLTAMCSEIARLSQEVESLRARV